MSTSSSTAFQQQSHAGSRKGATYESKRKQYQNCDHCRKYRRKCDAASLGITPATEDDGRSPKACSTCRKAGKYCTFEWLRTIPQKNLPRGVKRKLNEEYGVNTQNIKVDSSTDTEEVGNASTEATATPSDHTETSSPPSIGDSTAGKLERSRNRVNFSGSDKQQIPGLDANDFARKSISPPFHGQQIRQGFEVDSSRESSEMTWPPVIPSYLPRYTVPLKADLLNAAGDAPIETAACQVDDAMDASEWLDVVPFVPSPPQTLANPTKALAKFQKPHPGRTKRNNISKAFGFGDDETDEDDFSNYDFKLYDFATKSFIVSGLSQIYENSIENSMLCWGTEQNCPYERFNALVPSKASASDMPSSLQPTTLYKRAYQLDSALSILRTRPLTAAEDAASSRALKLAVMAFASQWSHDSLDASFSAEEKLPDSGNGSHEFSSFERLLRQSLFNEASLCVERWSGCDSFRLILAELLLFLTQLPPERVDVDEDQIDWGQEKSPLEYKSRNKLDYLSDDDPRSHSRSSTTDHFVGSKTFRMLMDDERRKTFLQISCQHLRSWHPKVQAFAKRILLHSDTWIRDRQEAIKACSNFNILFWLGVMCDTAHGVLDQRSLVISDDEAEPTFWQTAQGFGLGSSGEARPGDAARNELTRDSTSPGLWGSLLLDARHPCESPFLFKGDDFEERAGNLLREASPVKILLFRKVCHLQALLKENAHPMAVETCISDTLQVCSYWNTRYGDFFKNCLAEHRSLPFKIRSWYTLLLGHWCLAYLQIANLIEQFDTDTKEDHPEKTLRESSNLVLQLQKESAFQIASLAEISQADVVASGHTAPTQGFHQAVQHSAMITEPCADLMFLALSIACDALISWSNILRELPIPADPKSLWVHRNMRLDEVRGYCGNCIEALRLFGRQSEVARLTAKVFDGRINAKDPPRKARDGKSLLEKALKVDAVGMAY